MKKVDNKINRGIQVSDEELLIRVSLFKEFESTANSRWNALEMAAEKYNRDFAEKFGRTINTTSMYHTVVTTERGRELSGVAAQDAAEAAKKAVGWSKIDVSDIKRNLPKGGKGGSLRSEFD